MTERVDQEAGGAGQSAGWVDWLARVWRRRGLLFGLLMSLSISALGTKSGYLITLIPPVLPISAVFLLVAVSRGGVQRTLSTIRSSPLIFSLYVLVCIAEAFLMPYHGSRLGVAYVAGRIGFFLVFLSTAALCEDEEIVRDILRGMTYAVGLIGLLTLVHASGVFPVPFGQRTKPPRTFGPFRMPFPRTLGHPMSHNKFGILASVALATVMESGLGGQDIVAPLWASAGLFALAALGVLITQTRGPYLTVLAAIGLSACLWLDRRRQRPWYSRLRGSCAAALLYLGLLILANVLFPVVAPDFLLDVGSPRDVASALGRVDANTVAWRLFTESPLLGIGHGNFDKYHNGETGIHNHLLEQLASTGLAGGIPYLLFHVLILVGALRQLGHHEGLSESVSRVLCVSVLSALFAYQFFPGFFVSTFAVIGGMIVSRRRMADEAHVLQVPAS